jgi:single-strand DNA-binding protein
MYQKFTVIGHLGGDPDLRYTPAGVAYVRFSVAAHRKWSDGEGQVQDETTWYRVVVWGRQAEVCQQYLAKGRRVLIEGDRLRASPYLTKDNTPAASLDLTARFVRFLDSARPVPGGEDAPDGQGSLEMEDALTLPA